MDENQNASTNPNEAPKKGGMNMFVPVAIVGLIVIIAAAGFMFMQGQQGNQPQTVLEEQEAVPTVPQSMENSDGQSMGENAGGETADEYTDGTYTATGNYTSPGGAEQIDVNVTLEDGVIVDSEVSTVHAQRPNTVRFQGIFKDNYKPLVVGRNIDEVSLDKVSGSSLAPKGFNDALEQIKQQASA